MSKLPRLQHVRAHASLTALPQRSGVQEAINARQTKGTVALQAESLPS
jgi:hypothetical protein